MATWEPFVWSSAGESHRGCIRTVNEDAYLERPDLGLWAVADGMGGHSAGDLASRTIIEALNNIKPPAWIGSSVKRVYHQLRWANHYLREQASQASGSVIGSTIAVLIAHQHHCIYLWAGDSRVYRYRDGQLRCLTRDHRPLAELTRQGQLEGEESKYHCTGNAITRAVGAAEELELDAEIVEIEAGDTFLLCSDGLNRELNDQQIQGVLALSTPREAADTLIEQALDRGAHDNITVVVARVDHGK